MSLTAWSKRSPNNLSAILVVTIAAICLNLYYRDRPESKPDNTNSASAEIALSGTSPKVKAFLKMIRWAEGTDGVDGYRTQYTGAKFDDFSDHPRKVLCSTFNGKKLCSDASGAYQIMSIPTWDGQWVDGEKRIGLKEKLKLKDFSPQSQDLAAIDLLKDAGAIALIEKDDIAGAIAKSCSIWASLPCFDGDTQGAYSQSIKPLPALMQRFKENLEKNK
jgi:muramidase (phage lysozyme)